ncbi:MAG: DUF2795 domain-containing protein [Actinomycetota bacterium]
MDEHVTRQQMAYYVGSCFALTWASRTQLLRTAYDNNAPHEVILALVELPEQFFKNLDEVCDLLPRLVTSS